MKLPIRVLLLLLLSLAATSMLLAQASLQLPAFFSENMVLQRGMHAPVWGHAAPGTSITVTIAGKRATGKTDASGAWCVRLPQLKAGGPYTLTVSDGHETRSLANVLVGEVWLCSGQSNMARLVSESANADAEIAAAHYPQIRSFTVDPIAAGTPAPEVRGHWESCSPDTVPDFSALAYYFARDLHQQLKVPIGIIHASWGGSPIESWIPRAELQAHPEFQPILDYQYAAKDPVSYAEARRLQDQYIQENAQWGVKNPEKSGLRLGWAQAEFDDSAWPQMSLPMDWSKATPPLRRMGGAWFRKEITIPDAWAGKDLRVRLGRIIFFDTTYWNGTPVGATGMDNILKCGDFRRHYIIPGALVKPGRTVLAVHVVSRGDWGDLGGIVEGTLAVGPRDGAETIDLAGPWRYQVEFIQGDPTAMPKPQAPKGTVPAWTGGVLYNGMIAPLIPYGMAGVIWYQGEANAARAAQYRTLFPVMIRSWRQAWGQGNFPFLYMELATYKRPAAEPQDSPWAEMREAQREALTLPNTGMALTLDHPDRGEIHPANKQEAGHRLALVALAKVYGRRVPYLAPSYRAMSITGTKVRVSLTVPNGQLVAKDPEHLVGFAIAGADRKFVWAQARLVDAQTVEVWSHLIAQPVAVRYAWAETPELSLFDATGLPVSSFRTDNWPRSTEGAVAGPSGLPLVRLPATAQ